MTAGFCESVLVKLSQNECLTDKTIRLYRSMRRAYIKAKGQMRLRENSAKSFVNIQGPAYGPGLCPLQKQEGVTCFIDPQSNEADVGYYFQSIKVKETYLVRIDDKEFTDLLTECIQDNVE